MQALNGLLAGLEVVPGYFSMKKVFSLQLMTSAILALFPILKIVRILLIFLC